MAKKKPVVKKAVVAKALPKKVVAKKAAPKKVAVKKAVPKRAAGKKTTSAKVATQKAPAARKTTADPGAVVPTIRMPTRKARERKQRTQLLDAGSNLVPKGDMTTLVPGTLLQETQERSPVVRLIRPDWEDGHTIVRPLPALNPDDPGGDPDPVGEIDESGRFQPTDWVRQVPAIHYWGTENNKVSFLLGDPGTNPLGVDLRDNPAEVLYRNIRSVADNTKSTSIDKYVLRWGKLVTARTKIISPPTSMIFMFVIVYKKGKKYYFGKKAERAPLGLAEDDPVTLLQVKGSPWSKTGTVARLQQAILGMSPEWDGEPTDWENSLVNGDMVGLDSGRFITLYNGEKEPMLESGGSLDDIDDDALVLAGGVNPQAGAPQSGSFEGYRIMVTDKLHLDGALSKRTAKLVNTPQWPFRDMAMSKLVFFDDVLQFPCIEEQCLLIAKALRGVGDMIEFGWRAHPEFMTAEVKQILANSTQMLIPGMDEAETAEDAEGLGIAGGEPAAVVPPIGGAIVDDGMEEDEEGYFDPAIEGDGEILQEDESEVADTEDDAEECYVIVDEDGNEIACDADGVPLGEEADAAVVAEDDLAEEQPEGDVVYEDATDVPVPSVEDAVVGDDDADVDEAAAWAKKLEDAVGDD